MTTQSGTTPREGVDRCACGSKYWDANRCHSCGEAFKAAATCTECGDGVPTGEDICLSCLSYEEDDVE